MRQRNFSRRIQHGQTLVIALLVLFVLLILGAAFASILSRTIRGSSVAKGRGINSDLAESGIRFAHAQLVNSTLGADWRGIPTTLVQVSPDVTRDPDAYYLRPPARSPRRGALNFPGSTRADQGGPDGLGPFFRIAYRGGRALVRVRYAPGDPSIFSSTGIGYLKDPGLARNFLVIESVGRQGEIDPNDPTLNNARSSVQFQNYPNQAQFDTEEGKMQSYDAKEISSRKLIAMAQIGLIDYARMDFNKYKSTRPIEIGLSPDIVKYREGAGVEGTPVTVPTQMGDVMATYDLTPTGAGAFAGLYPSGGSMRVNGDLRFYGSVNTYLNQTFNDAILCSGTFQQMPGSSLTITKTQWNRSTNTWVVSPPTNMVLDSLNPAFSTFGGVLRDGFPGADGNNDVRGNGIIVSPSIESNSENTDSANTNRYITSTKDSGHLDAGGNTGIFGHGPGIFVNNASDFQIPDDETGRRRSGANASLVQDWLGSFGDSSADPAFRTGWHGPFYIPVGAFLLLTKDGFVIQRNANPAQLPTERTWKRADGSDSGLTTIRYRVGYGTDNQIHVINTLTNGLSASINNALTTADYDKGPVFNGVLYFEGNVRLRGVIPTDVQMTIVSNKTIYIEGSVLKGTEANDVTSAYPGVLSNNRLTRASKSSAMFMAKDYVTLNPTMFFGPQTEQNAQVSQGGTGVGGYSPDTLNGANGSTTLQFDTALSPYDPTNLANILPYESRVSENLTYKEFDPAAPNNPNGTNVFLNTGLLLTEALEYTNPGPTNAFYGLKVNRSAQILGGNEDYQFEVLNSPTNSAKLIWASINNPLPAPNFGNIYGLGTEAFQQSPKFETVKFPLVVPTASTINIPNNRYTNTFNTNSYEMQMQGTNSLELFLTQFGTQASGNYQLARAAAVPMDIRIEASIFAEEGSFFVIPGDWFNMNPNDRRDTFEARVATLVGLGQTQLQARDAASQERLDNFGTTAGAPFYGEPIDVKINIVGSIAENMPPAISAQSEWMKKWGWMPTKQAGAYNSTTGAPTYIPVSHVSNWTKANPGIRPFTSNLTLSYDTALATGRVGGTFGFDTPFDASNPGNANGMIRTTQLNGVTYQLAPMPRLPVSPTLAFFGESK
ncbi:MAG: hypothetical protein WCG75_02825 [Armatimonadota bacterium]